MAEVIGTLILITIAVAAFSALSLIILNPLTTPSTDSYLSTTLVSYINAGNPRTIVIEHRGGESLNHYRVTFTISTATDPPTVTTVTETESDAGPHVWMVGERCSYTAAASLTNKKVEVTVLDTDTNIVLLNKVVQDVDAFATPYVQVFNPNEDPNGVTDTTAVLRMYYNFVKYNYYFSPLPGTVNFVYQKLDSFGNPVSNQSTAPITPLPLDGWYSVLLSGLSQDTRYQVRAVILWGSSVAQTSFVQFWTYSNARGLWHLDEGLHGGGAIAFDSAQPPTDGEVHGASFVGDILHNNGFLNFTAEHQNVEVPNNYKFDLDYQMTVREWVNSRPGGSLFYGQITEIDNASLNSLPAEWIEPTVIHISGDVYAAVYHTSVDPGSTITTFHLPESGIIPGPFSVIDTQIFPVGNYRNNPYILSLGNGLYAVSYGSRYFDSLPAGYIMTVSIAEDGLIGDSIIDQMMTSSYFGKESRIFHVNGSVYGAVFGGDYSKTYVWKTGGIVTFSIDDLGYFSMPISSQKFPEDYCSKVDVVPVSGNIFALAFDSDSNGSACIRTIQIDDAGLVTFLRRAFFSLANYMEPSIVASGLSNLYIVAYGGDSSHPLQGTVRTVSIASDGTIGGFSGFQLFPSNASVDPKIFALKENIYLIAYSEGSPSVQCHAFTVKVTDHIEYRDDLKFYLDGSLNPLQGLGAAIVGVNELGDHFLIVYGSGLLCRGMMATVNVNFVSVPQIMIKKGDMFQIEIVDATVTATVRTSDGLHSVSGTLPSIGGWNHVVVTYAAFTLTLYINCVPSGQTACSGTLTSNTDPVIFGDGFIGYLDEIGIYAQALDAAGVANDYLITNHYA